MKVLIFVIVALAATSCTTLTQPNFVGMSEGELAAYNSRVAESDRIFCARTQNQRGSVTRYVTRKSCGTLQEVGHLLNRGYILPTDSTHAFDSMERYQNRGGPNPYRGPRIYRY